MTLAFAGSLGSGVANTSVRNLIRTEEVLTFAAAAVEVALAAGAGLLPGGDDAGRAVVEVVFAAVDAGCPEEQDESAIRPDATSATIAAARNTTTPYVRK